MKERVLIDLHDLIEYVGYGDIYPTAKFIKTCKKSKLNHLAGVGWPVFEKDKLPLVGDNCAVWLNDESIPMISIHSIFDKSAELIQLEDFYSTNKNLIGILWVDRAFDID